MHLWEVAEALGMQDSNFSRELRHECTDERIELIVSKINEIKEARNHE